MERPKVYFIGVTKSKSNEQVARAVVDYFDEGTKAFSECSAIICSSSQLAISYAISAQEKTFLPTFYTNILTDEPVQGISALPRITELPAKYSKKRGNKFALNFDNLLKDYSEVFIFVENDFLGKPEWGSLEPFKSIESTEIYSCDPKLLSQNVISDHHFQQVQDHIKASLKEVLQSLYRDYSEEVVDVCMKLKEKIDEVTGKAKDLSQKLVVTPKTKNNSSDKKRVEETQDKVRKTFDNLTNLKEVILKARDHAETLYPPPAKVIPAEFYLIRNVTLQDDGKWEIKLVNTTQDYFRQLEIWCIETKEKICEFKLVEPNSRIKKIISVVMPEEEFFYKHLIAQSEGKIVSVAYPVTPIQLISVEKDEEHENQFICTLTNMSKKLYFRKLEVACAQSPEVFGVEDSTIKYSEDTTATVRFEKTPHEGTFLVLDGNKIVSNRLLTGLKDEEDEEEEEEEEKSEEDSEEQSGEED
ncbi:unnamed protein product [Blepharisma stoltei]|uniref:Uncharacterized protein n=1 Tax=Blepharisma stoltei TaxID=1481888 RepID=A0AAU9IFL5_9CILI|nr:unnamed protein product [Blepharisma stoltei]